MATGLRYPNDGDTVPVKLALGETSVVLNEKGCVPGNIGTRVQIDDRVFRLGKFNAAFELGKLYGMDTANAASFSDEIDNGITAASVGDTEITITSTAAFASAAENAYAKGYIYITFSTGLGQTLRIKSSTAATSANAITFTLYDPLTVALAATTDCIVQKNPYSKPLICLGDGPTNTGYILGVPSVNSTSGTTPTSTVDIYAWLQTWGPCAVYSEAVGAHGEALMVSASASYDGGVVVSDGTVGHIGQRMSAAAVAVIASYTPVYLKIAP